MPHVHLRLVTDADHDALFVWQTLPTTIHRDSGSQANATNRATFDADMQRLRTDRSVVFRAIAHQEDLVGHVMARDTGHTPQISFGIAPARRGEGLATAGLIAFTDLMIRRPLQARVSATNPAAMRVLENAGFALCNAPGIATAQVTGGDALLYELGFFPAATPIGSSIP